MHNEQSKCLFLLLSSAQTHLMRRSKSERKSSKKNADENRSLIADLLTEFRLRHPPPFPYSTILKMWNKTSCDRNGRSREERGGEVLHAKKVEEAIDRERGGRYVAHVRPTYVLLLLPLYMRYLLLLLLLLPGSLSPGGAKLAVYCPRFHRGTDSPNSAFLKLSETCIVCQESANPNPV